MKRCWLLLGCGLLSFARLAAVAGAQEVGGAQVAEVSLSDREIKRLDIFEDRALSQADAAFGRAEYGQAAQRYDSFLQKFPQSTTLAYVLFKKGRCTQLEGKLPEAIEQYKQVAERFPKDVKYAVPALYYMAECQAREGADAEAIQAWARIAEEESYAKCPLAAPAVAKLAAALSRQDKGGEALSYYERIAVSLGDCEQELAQQAIGAVVRQHVRTKPDEAKLWEFYKKIRPDAQNAAPDDPSEGVAFWAWVCEGIRANGTFSWSEREQKKAYYQHWVGVMEGKFPESDDFQIGLASIRYEVDRDKTKLTEALDRQFQKHHKKGDWKRILKWVRAYKGNWTKIKEYAAMPDFAASGVEGISQLMDVLCNEQQEHYLAKRTFSEFCEKTPFEELSNEDVRKLILLAHEVLNDRTTAKTLAGKLNLDNMSDEQKLQLARELLKLDAGIAEQVFIRLDDKHAGQLELLEQYYRDRNLSGALPILDELAGVEKYAREARLKKAQLLQWNERYTEAIAAYQLVDDPPANLWQIVECHVALEDADKAVEQLREIESRFKDQAAKAAYRIAHIYLGAEDKQNYVASLRKLVKKYPNSAEAARAEKEQEEQGIPPALPDAPFGL